MAESKAAGEKQVGEKRKYCFVSGQMSDVMYLARRESGLSQSELGQLVGVSVITISRLERGVAQRVNRATVQRIERALDLADGALLKLREPSGVGLPSKVIQSTASQFCRHCGRRLQRDSNFCYYCGARTLAAGTCGHCGAMLYSDSIYCHRCGKKLKR